MKQRRGAISAEEAMMKDIKYQPKRRWPALKPSVLQRIVGGGELPGLIYPDPPPPKPIDPIQGVARPFSIPLSP
ncbi:MAG: hypothetical protein HC834_06945 [Rhodospirillales bacterium]|nr:hypothetical protein [Rhodospirillales bacterium]